MSGSQVVEILLCLLTTLAINGLCFAGKEALSKVNMARLQQKENEGEHTSTRIIGMAKSPSTILSAIRLLTLVSHFAMGAFLTIKLAFPFAKLLFSHSFLGLSLSTLNVLSVAVTALFSVFIVLVFGVFLPRQIAAFAPYKTLSFVSGFLLIISKLLFPLTKLASMMVNGLLHVFGIYGKTNAETVTEDEILMMVDVGHESGLIDFEEKAMIENVFEFDNTTARDIMTHRVDVVAIETDLSTEEIIKIIAETGMSRFPVYDDSYDDIIGILNARTYLLNLREDNPKPLKSLLRPACFVPETVPADTLLRDMQQRKDHLAIVLDEYGGFLGIITMEDLIEEIVGNIYDEFDLPEEPTIRFLSENLWRIAGEAEIELIEEKLGVSLPEERDYDTLGGLIFSQISSIPEDGRRIELDIYGLHIATEPVEDHHVEWAKVSKIVEDEQDGITE